MQKIYQSSHFKPFLMWALPVTVIIVNVLVLLQMGHIVNKADNTSRQQTVSVQSPLTNIAAKNNNSPNNNCKDKSLNERKINILALMQTDPESAYDLMLSPEDLIEPNKRIPDCQENISIIEGELKATHFDDFTNKVSDTTYELKKEDGSVFTLHPIHQFTDVIPSQTKITVKGYVLDNSVLFDPSNSISPEKVTGMSISPVLGKTTSTGGIKLVVVPLKHRATTPIMTKAEIENSVFGTDPASKSTNLFYQENSYGSVSSVTGVVLDWYDVPDSTCPFLAWPNIDWLSQQVDLSKYSGIVLLSDDGGCGGYSGAAVFGKTRVGRYSMHVIHASARFERIGLSVIAHEMGHTYFRLLHDGNSTCTDQPFPPGSNCTGNEYGDVTSTMGMGKGHFSPPYKKLAGFFASGNLVNVRSSGTYYLEPYETKSNGPKALMINDGATHIIYLSYRQPIGFDDGLLSSFSGSDFYNGVMGNTGVTRSLTIPTLIDISTPYGDAYYHGTLLPGSSFTNPETGTVVAVSSVTPQRVTLTVTMN